jgi:hypothetical protein
MEARGVDMSWYWKARKSRGGKAQVQSPREALKESRCSILSAKLIEYGEIKGVARIYTVTSSGAKYVQVREELTKKTGDPVYWCSCCDKVFKAWEQFNEHCK